MKTEQEGYVQKARVVISAVVVALLLALASNRAMAKPSRPTNPSSHIRAVNYKDLDKYGCVFVVTYDERKIKYIAVKTVLIYHDGTETHDYLPRVFHSDKDAIDACHSFEGEVEKVLRLGR